MRSLNLWLLRHGETEINTGHWSAKPNETRLTPLGIEQAQKSATLIISRPELFLVSPLVRAQQTLEPIAEKWPNTPVITSPIQEFVYLSPKRLYTLDKAKRREQINDYWLKNDPYYCDGEDCESFASFMQRVSSFHEYLRELEGYVVAIGHGQFFKAFQLGLSNGFSINKKSMNLFRAQENAAPIKNGEIIQLHFENMQFIS